MALREKRAVASLLLSASQCSPPSASGRKTSLRGEGWNFFTFGRDVAREMNILARWEALLKMGGTCIVCERTEASLSSAIWKRF